MKQSYATVKNEVEYQKRKALDSQQVKPQAAKRVRAADENAQKTTALLEELLERGDTRPCAPLQAPAGPTDFSGLFPKVGGAPLCNVTQQARAARTFEDLPNQQKARQALAELPGSDWLPPVLPAFNTDATNIIGAAAAVAGGDRQLPASCSAPLDWSLKTTVRFSSPAPFTIVEEASYQSSAKVLQAQRAFASAEGINALDPPQLYLAALHSWQFPQDPWRQPASGAAKLRAPPPEVLQRRQDWQAAFASLYDALRNGACDAFYYISPEGTKKPFAAFFGAAGVCGRPRLHAMLTRSTAGLRALMAGSMVLGFSAPLLPGDADRRALEQDLSAVPLDGSQSLLVFEGAVRVHGLFDFLLNEAFKSHGDECDVPTLLAPVQFAHASLRAFQPKVLGVSDARDPGRSQHRLELRASALPPWVVDRLSVVLAGSQAGNFSMACDTHPLTLALNWCPSSSSNSKSGPGPAGQPAPGSARRSSRRQALGGACTGRTQQQQLLPPLTDCDARERGLWDAEEAARWRGSTPGLSCNVVREVRCEDGTLVAKLSAKSAERVVLS